MNMRVLGAPRLLEKHRIQVRSPRPCLAGRGDVLVLAFPRHGRYRRARKLNQERPVSTMDPQGPNRPHHDPASAEQNVGTDQGAAPQQPGVAYGTAPDQAVPGSPKKKRGKGMFIALGCGLIILVFVLIAGCSAIFALSGSDDDAGDPAASHEAAGPEEAEQEEAAAEEGDGEGVPAEEPAEEEAPGQEDAPVQEDAAAEEPAEDAAAEEPAEDEVPAEEDTG